MEYTLTDPNIPLSVVYSMIKETRQKTAELIAYQIEHMGTPETLTVEKGEVVKIDARTWDLAKTFFALEAVKVAEE